MKKSHLKILFVLIAATSVILFCIFSPLPAIWFFKVSFNINRYTLPENYDILKSNAVIIRNIDYNSAYPDGKLDVILPLRQKSNEKLIFWIHGGGFISGDKSMTEHYMVMLANEGFAVVNINYAVAPESRYPVQLKQIEEACSYIKENAAEYGLNADTIYMGGDSAGAQLAAQFANIQTNAEYAAQVNDAVKNTGIAINDVTGKSGLAGLILFCGPYNLKEFIEPEKNTMILPFKKIGWAYFNTRDPENKSVILCNTARHIDKNFPPVFITDGNTLSFENQAKELEAALKSANVPVKSVFYPKEEAILKHEYQFYMDTPHAQNTFSELLNFLSGNAVWKEVK